MRRRAALAAVLAAILGAWPASSRGQDAPDAWPTPARAVSRIVAPSWMAEDARDDAGEFEAVARLLRLRPGMRVADIGAGSGYYVARLAPLVGPTGEVWAEDIVPRYLEGLTARVARERLANVRVVEGTQDDPRLPARRIDAALMIHMYHEIASPFALLARLAPAMAPGGVLAILDMRFDTGSHGTPPDLLRCELAAVGWRQVGFEDTAPSEYVALFAPPATPPTAAQVRARLAAAPCRS